MPKWGVLWRREAAPSATTCGRGGIGRRAALRSLWGKLRGSSSLLDRTITGQGRSMAAIRLRLNFATPEHSKKATAGACRGLFDENAPLHGRLDDRVEPGPDAVERFGHHLGVAQ